MKFYEQKSLFTKTDQRCLHQSFPKPTSFSNDSIFLFYLAFLHLTLLLSVKNFFCNKKSHRSTMSLIFIVLVSISFKFFFFSTFFLVFDFVLFSFYCFTFVIFPSHRYSQIISSSRNTTELEGTLELNRNNCYYSSIVLNSDNFCISPPQVFGLKFKQFSAGFKLSNSSLPLPW